MVKSKSITQRVTTNQRSHALQLFSQDDFQLDGEKQGQDPNKIFSDSDEKYSIQSLSGAIRQKLFQDDKNNS